MTGGRIKACSPYLDSTFMMTYGDGLSDVNLDELVEFHNSKGVLLTLTTVNPNSRYGQLNISSSGMITKFSEKPHFSNDWVNAGFMVVEPDVFRYIDDDQTVFEQEPLQKLSSSSYLAAYKHSGFWQCMDTLRDKNHLEELWAKNASPWPKVGYPKQ
jgi:glucose-1-phosphate cytidylyltransferase